LRKDRYKQSNFDDGTVDEFDFWTSRLIRHDHKMKTYHLKRRQRLSTDGEKAWSFFSNPSNLSLITPPWLAFRITSKLPTEIYAGLIITYTIRLFAGIAVPWVSEITQVKQPHFFVDEQHHGPFSSTEKREIPNLCQLYHLNDSATTAKKEAHFSKNDRFSHDFML
jgi:hypothetical protein